MRRTVIGILAHVDAGKTTLSEAMLYCSGAIRTLGRVDHGSTFLDTFALERARGITIFSKQAVLNLPEMQATLLDTPGHADFSAEMERTLDVLDCAVLVLSAPAGIQSHTITLWKLLRQRRIPTLVFVNKMDLPGASRENVMEQLHSRLGDGFADFTAPDPEALALCDERMLDELLEQGQISASAICRAVADCKLYPCFFGAALKLEGVEQMLKAIADYVPESPCGEKFGAKVFKISRDGQDVRLTHLKITGGVLRVRDTIKYGECEEKVTQLRVYSGAKFKAADAAYPGDVVAAVGLSSTAPGQGLGAERAGESPSIEPVLTYKLILPPEYDAHKALNQLRRLEEEEPQLHVVWDERLRELRVQLMGAVQLEILRQLLLERFGLEVDFGPGAILYRETIAQSVEGVGHYEPLRHYAEVHLQLEPGSPGSGLRFCTSCPEDVLDRNWQRLILTHLAEKQHLGVLTGSPITDMTITLTAGRAHERHTEGGDFRQATYRAVRQGLMSARSVLLEPWYDFTIELPRKEVGRAITDLQRMGAECSPTEIYGDTAVISGSAPVAALRDYPAELTAYTHGLGRFSCALRGYAPCKEQSAVVERLAYDPEADLENTPDSVFCGHGAGFTVKWYDVPRYMHLSVSAKTAEVPKPTREQAARYCDMVASDKELMAIFERTYGPIRTSRERAMRPAQHSAAPRQYRAAPQPEGPEYVLVDGYNIIFAWDELRELARDNLDAARTRLIDRLRNYQGFRQCPVIVVFDAYKVKGNPGNIEHLGGLSVVYTKEAETADMYIEKATYDLGKKHRVRVATSDGMEQIIILGNGALRVPASAFEEEVKEVEAAIREYLG
jgi:ribosomal protection tetracycline resistance protein